MFSNKGKSFDYVYIDPPFHAKLYKSCLSELANSTVLENNATVIVEHFFKDVLGDNYGSLYRYRLKKIGDSSLSFYTINKTQ